MDAVPTRSAGILAVAIATGLAAGCGANLPATRLEAVGAARGGPARFEDADLRAELTLEGEALVLVLTNRGSAPLEVRWESLIWIGPDHREAPLDVQALPGPIAGGTTVRVRVPAPAPPARKSTLELVLPTVIRGVERHYHYHLRAR